MRKSNARVLVISDTHFPYAHPDIVRFLRAVRDRYKPTRVVHVGDEGDFHGVSFHDKNPDLLSPGHELERMRLLMRPVFELFPVADVAESNHGSLIFRRAKHLGLPAAALVGYRELIGAPKGWRWHPEVLLHLPDGSECMVRHGVTKDPHRWAKPLAMHTVNGHFHEDFQVKYWRTPRGLFWSMVVGCLINDRSLAYEYNKLNVSRPIYGVGLILNSHPVLVPMLTNRNDRWTGVLP